MNNLYLRIKQVKLLCFEILKQLLKIDVLGYYIGYFAWFPTFHFSDPALKPSSHTAWLDRNQPDLDLNCFCSK